jgi:hypothetical protein
MQNRRQSERLYFSVAERPRIELEIEAEDMRLTALVLDLGMEGMRLRLPGRTPPLALDASVRAKLQLPRLETPLTVVGTIVYLERLGAVMDCGVRFLPLLLPAANDERKRILAGYLKAEQRRQPKGRSKVRLGLFRGT